MDHKIQKNFKTFKELQLHRRYNYLVQNERLTIGQVITMLNRGTNYMSSNRLIIITSNRLNK